MVLQRLPLMDITLTKAEQLTAHKAAIFLAENNKDYWPNATTGSVLSLHDFLAQDAQSIASEWVVAKLMGYRFDPYEQKGKRIADVGDNLEIRWTKYDYGKLIVRKYDRNEDIAILVTGEGPTYTVVGAMPVKMARTDKYKHPTQPNYWVPQPDLRSIEMALYVNTL